jgi:hypothetical protein
MFGKTAANHVFTQESAKLEIFGDGVSLELYLSFEQLNPLLIE